MATLSAAIFRRGGQKKESSQNPTQIACANIEEVDDDTDEKIVSSQDLLAAISTPRSGKEFSAAIWRSHAGAAEMVKSRKATAQANVEGTRINRVGLPLHTGFTWHRKHFLHIEEAVFFVDRGDLMLFAEVQGQQRLLSVQEGYELMASCSVTMERYLVYAHLMRSGYLVMRHPSRWLLEPEESPHGCWEQWSSNACVATPLNSEPAPFAEAVEVSMQQQHQRRKLYPSSKQPLVSAVGVGDEPDMVPNVGGTQHGTGSVVEEYQQQEEAARQQRAHRQWWETVGPSHGGVFEHDAPRHAVQDSPGQQLKLVHPRLKPLGPIPDGPHLGSSSPSCRIIFDVYKPGSKVARAKRHFPDVMWHLAICSAKPPSPQEIRLADAQVRAIGSDAPIVWASVDNTIISFFQIIGVDMIKLV